MNRQIVVIAVGLVLIGACDPQDGDPKKTATRADKVVKAEDRAPTAVAAADAPRELGADPVGYFLTCIDRCTIDGKQSERCKSACKSEVASSPVAPAPPCSTSSAPASTPVAPPNT
jgi:hypothetical protein